MTTSLGTNSDNDIYLGADGNLVIVTGITAVEQNCEAAMEAQLAEMVLALDQGIPTDQTIWSSWNPAQFEAYSRATLLSVPHVTAVTSFAVVRSGENANYTATIMTDLGPTDISGLINLPTG